eukprot:TRINITY_DN271_c0_g1_i3.p1 TRINITY_DN271_c0_g1~~TRINITY_DN271_c0_g1_i3.p1  ORF type:complete len:179 (-),score=6.78 TRINITY_DN271_c0_g1_i3:51-587(-)
MKTFVIISLLITTVASQCFNCNDQFSTCYFNGGSMCSCLETQVTCLQSGGCSADAEVMACQQECGESACGNGGSSGSTSGSPKNHGLSTSAEIIIGAVSGTALLLVIIILSAVGCARRRRRCYSELACTSSSPNVYYQQIPPPPPTVIYQQPMQFQVSTTTTCYQPAPVASLSVNLNL